MSILVLAYIASKEKRVFCHRSHARLIVRHVTSCSNLAYARHDVIVSKIATAQTSPVVVVVYFVFSTCVHQATVIKQHSVAWECLRVCFCKATKSTWRKQQRNHVFGTVYAFLKKLPRFVEIVQLRYGTCGDEPMVEDVLHDSVVGISHWRFLPIP